MRFAPFFKPHEGGYLKSILFLVTAALGTGFILGEISFAKLGIPLPLRSHPGLPTPALYIFEIYLLFLLSCFFYSAKHTGLIKIYSALSLPHLLATILLIYGGLRSSFDFLTSPMLVIRNTAFLWYLFVPLLLSLLPIKTKEWEKLFYYFQCLPILSVGASLAFLWLARPEDVSQNSYFAEYIRIRWALGIGVYGALAYGLSQKWSGKTILILTIIALALGMEHIIKVSRTNLLGILLTLGVVILVNIKNYRSLLRISGKVIFMILLAFGYYQFLTTQKNIMDPVSKRIFHDKTISVPNALAPFIKSETGSGGVERFRSFMLLDAWTQFMEHPLFGIGFKKQVVYRFYEGAEKGFHPNDGSHESPPGAPIAGPHNSYLNALTRLGVPGLLLLILHLSSLFILYKKHLYATAFALAGGMLYAFFNVGLEGPGRSVPLLLALGVAWKAYLEENEKDKC